MDCTSIPNCRGPCLWLTQIKTILAIFFLHLGLIKITYLDPFWPTLDFQTCSKWFLTLVCWPKLQGWCNLSQNRFNFRRTSSNNKTYVNVESRNKLPSPFPIHSPKERPLVQIVIIVRTFAKLIQISTWFHRDLSLCTGGSHLPVVLVAVVK